MVREQVGVGTRATEEVLAVGTSATGAARSEPFRRYPRSASVGKDGRVLAGFAGAAADAFTLFELFEAKLEKHGQLTRAAVEMAKDWRTERRFGKLEALLAVADADTSLVISGTGDVIEPEDGLIAIGSGGMYALSAARALLAHSEMDAKAIATEALKIAGDICIYTNQNIVVETL